MIALTCLHCTAFNRFQLEALQKVVHRSSVTRCIADDPYGRTQYKHNVCCCCGHYGFADLLCLEYLLLAVNDFQYSIWQPFSNVPRMHPPILVDGFCCLLFIFVVSNEVPWTFKTNLRKGDAEQLTHIGYQYTHMYVRIRTYMHLYNHIYIFIACGLDMYIHKTNNIIQYICI